MIPVKSITKDPENARVAVITTPKGEVFRRIGGKLFRKGQQMFYRGGIPKGWISLGKLD